MSDTEKFHRLSAAIASGGQIPADLRAWVLIAAATATGVDVEHMPTTPVQRLAIRLSEQVDRWMLLRRVTTRTISVPRRTLARCLKGENVTIETIADVADALGCEAFIEFLPRPGVGGTTAATDGTKPLSESRTDATMRSEEPTP